MMNGLSRRLSHCYATPLPTDTVPSSTHAHAPLPHNNRIRAYSLCLRTPAYSRAPVRHNGPRHHACLNATLARCRCAYPHAYLPFACLHLRAACGNSALLHSRAYNRACCTAAITAHLYANI